MKLISGPVARLLLSIASTSYPFEGNLEKRKKNERKKETPNIHLLYNFAVYFSTR